MPQNKQKNGCDKINKKLRIKTIRLKFQCEKIVTTD